MMSSVKRLCTSSLKKTRWSPVVDDEHLRLPTVQSMLVARIKDRQLTGEILKLINQIYPWTNALKHIRRIHNADILLYPPDFANPIESSVFNTYFLDETRIVNIPETPCLLRWQHDRCIEQHWPNLVFRENPLLEQAQAKKSLTENDHIILDLLNKIEGDGHPCAIIVDNDGQIPLVGARDHRADHPLQHSSMVAIDCLAANSVYHRGNLLEQYLEKKDKSAYLLNGCSIYLSVEPCIMCAMALLHSRISTVYYLRENATSGALGSRYKLHTSKKTNHRFQVYRLEEE